MITPPPPIATHVVAEKQETLASPPIPRGTDLIFHVTPPFDEVATTPFDDVVVGPTAMQVVFVTQVTFAI
jgi:hypothetical protein